MLSNTKLGVKLGLGFGVLLLMIVAFAFGTYWIADDIKANATLAKDESLVYTNIAHQMKMDAVQVQQWLTDISATRALDGLDDGFKEAENSRRSFLQGTAAFKEMFARENDNAALQETRQLERDMEDYFEAGKVMAQAYIDGGPALGNTQMAAFDETAETLTNALEPFVESQTTELEESMTTIIASISSLEDGVLIASLFSLALGILCGVLITRSIKTPLQENLDFLGDIARGDLTREVDITRGDEMGDLAKRASQMQDNLRDMIAGVASSADRVASAGEEISASATQQAQGATTQKDQVAQVSTAMQEMATTVAQVSQNSEQAATAASEAAKTARAGGQIVEGTLAKMRAISSSVGDTARKVQELGASSDQIGEIIGVIDEIADQTNLLALNAAIEAARAGEQGRGFAVVADEVRKLAERTTKATKEIATMIKNIQVETKSAVEAMQAGTKQVEEGVETTTQAGTSLKEIILVAEKVGEMVTHIATSATEQASATEQVNANIAEIAKITAESALGIEQSAKTCTELSTQAVDLQNLVGQFKLSEDGHGRGAGDGRGLSRAGVSGRGRAGKPNGSNQGTFRERHQPQSRAAMR